jgi:acetolactate synthase I/II/III large subunit
MNGAEILCDTLLANGVDVCFANPGTSEMHFVAALDRKPQMRCVLGLFEGVVTGAADGYARMAEKPAATLLHLGPGLANGLANLHNARRARSPVLNIVGDHATYHMKHDAPLTSDIDGLAAPMSGWVKRITSADTVSDDTAHAIAAANGSPGAVATLILHADAAWSEPSSSAIVRLDRVEPALVPQQRVEDIAGALRNGKRSLLLLAGNALRGSALETSGRIAQATHARIMADRTAARIERGAGRVDAARMPYKLETAMADLRDIEQLVLVGATVPVAFFAYPGKPSVLINPDCRVLTLAEAGENIPMALEHLADALGIPASMPVACEERRTMPLPGGALSADAIHIALGHLIPENAIVCDESISSAVNFFRYTRGAAPHDYLPLTGGSIGLGLPLAVGAAIACPNRKVIGLQADGSGMYTLQALWTQAREQLDVTTIVFSNRSYAILHRELRDVGAGEAGRNARRMLDLDQPAMNWALLANGMGVEATRSATVEEFTAALQFALSRSGPYLIEAML